VTEDEQRGVRLGFNEPQCGQIAGKSTVPGPGCLLKPIQGLAQVTNQIGVSWIGKTRGPTAVDSLSEGVMEEGILHIELLNRPVMGDGSGEHRAHGGRFHNRAETLVVVDSGALSGTPKDPASLVAIEGPVSAELVCEDPSASHDVGALRSWNKVPCPITHQGPVLILHSRAPIGIGVGSADGGRDRGRCRRRSGGGEDESIR
jgi:hypothetical protein